MNACGWGSVGLSLSVYVFLIFSFPLALLVFVLKKLWNVGITGQSVPRLIILFAFRFTPRRHPAF
jgi:hypothetical protein